MDIAVAFTRNRSEFGRHCYFSDRPATIIATIPPNHELLAEYVLKNPIPHATHSAPDMSEHWVNTDEYGTKNQGVLHQEGGWPRDIDSSEVEPKLRYRKKIEKDDDYIHSVKTLGDEMEKYIKLNNAVNIYEEYFGVESATHASEPPSAKVVVVLRDPTAGGGSRAVSCLSWQPEGPSSRKLAVAYSLDKEYIVGGSTSSMSSYIWDIDNTNQPFLELIPTSPLKCIAYNPRDENIILGGSRNGLLSFWDVRRGSQVVDTSPIERSHRDIVYDISWVVSKTMTEFCSASPDGTVLWWDTRKLGEPVETLSLSLGNTTAGRNLSLGAGKVQNSANSDVKLGGSGATTNAVNSLFPNATTPSGSRSMVGGVCIDLDQPSATRFLVGTDQGLVLWCNRKGKSANDRDRIVQAYSGHHGPVYAVHRNPFLTRYFLTVGDWSAKIYTEDLNIPIMSTRYHSTYLTDGCWSPTRPGVFLTTRRDGVLDIWDYLYKTNDPALSVQVCKEALACLAAPITPQGMLLAAGSVDGNTTLLRLADSLALCQNNEKAAVNQMLERETRRERNLETQGKEARAVSISRENTEKTFSGVQQRQQQLPPQTQPQQQPTSATATTTSSDLADLLSKVESEFYRTVNNSSKENK